MWRLVLFLVINFGALGIGSMLMGNISNNEWYTNAEKAPWTPPGWVFGAAWFSIMLALSIFMYIASNKYTFEELKPFYWIFALQFVLNVMWNPVFFRWHMMWPGLFIIVALTITVGYMLWWGRAYIGAAAWLIAPYFIWLLIATSLNAYIAVKNN